MNRILLIVLLLFSALYVHSQAGGIELYEISAQDSNRIVITKDVGGVIEQVYKPVSYLFDSTGVVYITGIFQTTNPDALNIFYSDGNITSVPYDASSTNEIEIPTGGNVGEFITRDVQGGLTWRDIQFMPSSGNDGEIIVVRADNFGNKYLNYELPIDADTQLTESEVDTYVANNGYLTTEVDGSVTNEIELPTGGVSGQVLSTDGSGVYNWVDGSVSSSNLYNIDGTLTGDRYINLNGFDLKIGTFGDDIILDANVWLDANKLYGFTHNNSSTLSTTIGGLQNAQKYVAIGNSGLQNAISQFSSGTTGDNYPAHTFSTDLNTGVGLYGLDQLSLITGGQTRLIIDEVGNVGIGTNAPSEKLEVLGNTYFRNNSGFGLLNDDSDRLQITAASTASGAGFQKWVYSPSSPNAYFLRMNQVVTSANVRYSYSMVNNNTAYNDMMTFTLGNVGINNVNPTERLDVSGNVKTIGFIMPTGAANGNVLTSDANGVASWQSGGGQLTEPEVDAFVANNGYLTNEIDGSVTNEAQTITQSGNNITLSAVNGVGGGTVTVAGGSTDGVLDDIVETVNFNAGVTRLMSYERTNGLSDILHTYKDLTGWLSSSGAGGVTYFYPNTTSALNARVGIGVLNPSYPLDVNGSARLNAIVDDNNTTGSAGQVLSSTGTAIEWIAPTIETAQLNNPTGSLSISTTAWSNLNWGSGGSSTNIGASSTTESFTNNSGAAMQLEIHAMLKFSGDVASKIDVGVFINNSTNPFRDYRYYLNMNSDNSYSLHAIVNLSAGDVVNFKSRQTSTSSAERVDTLDADSTIFVQRNY